MVRLTAKGSGGTCSVADGHTIEEVIDRLAGYENLYESLNAERDKTAADMEKLRAEARTKTVTYNQLLANKILITNILDRLDLYTK